MNSSVIKILYKELLDRYNILLRKSSLVHPLILKKFESELNQTIERIENLFCEDSSSDYKFFILSLRKLIYKLENILNIDVTNEYNKYVSSSLATSYTDDFNVPNTENTNFEESEPVKALYPNIVWEKVQDFLRQRLNIHTYNVWVKPVKYHSCSNNIICISVQNSYFKNWLEEHCATMIKDHLGELNLEYDVKFITA